MAEINEMLAEKIQKLKKQAYYCFACGDEANEQVGARLLEQAENLEEEWWPQRARNLWDRAGENAKWFKNCQERGEIYAS